MTTFPVPWSPSQVNASESAQWLAAIRQAISDLRVAIPAQVISVNDNQTVNVQVLVRERVRTPTGAKWVAIPQISNVPFLIPRGGGYSITLPLKAGDEGLLIFCDMCIDAWWQSGGQQNQLEVRRHDLTDCGFFPGLWSQPNKLANWSTTSMQIRRDDGGAIIDVSATEVAVKNYGGTALPLVNDNFYQWVVDNVLPFLQSKGYAGPAPPSDSETTILMGQ